MSISGARLITRAGIVLLLVGLLLPACANRSDPQAPATSVAVAHPAADVAAPPPAAAMPVVASAIPSLLSVPALGLTAPVGVMSDSSCPVLNPPTLDDAYWVGCRAKPGTDSDGTVFIIGHSRANGPAVFNDLERTTAGDTVELSTPSGRLVYRVEHTIDYAKFGQIQSSPEVLDRVPGRLVLVTCLLEPGNASSTKNFVVQAQLVGAVAAGR